MSYSDQVTKYLRNVRLPQSQNERFALALGATALLGSPLLLPTLYRDYKKFLSYGPGGIPSNFVGWVFVRLIFQPFSREMLSTSVYEQRVAAAEGHGERDDGYLTLESNQARDVEDRPVVGVHVVPQRQLSQVPDEAAMHRFVVAFRAFEHRNSHLVKFQRSGQEAHADGLFLADNIAPHDLAKQTNGEIAHLHSGNDHSAHMTLHPADCKKVIEAGWGQRHGLSGSPALNILSFGTKPNIPAEFLLIYAPRDEAEIETFMQILAASVKFMTGREDVRLHF